MPYRYYGVTSKGTGIIQVSVKTLCPVADYNPEICLG
jgi:hypothetical protein